MRRATSSTLDRPCVYPASAATVPTAAMSSATAASRGSRTRAPHGRPDRAGVAAAGTAIIEMWGCPPGIRRGLLPTFWATEGRPRQGRVHSDIRREARPGASVLVVVERVVVVEVGRLGVVEARRVLAGR